jgi:hypothetical protein
MERRAVIHFFTLKRLKVKNIHAELAPVYGREPLALPTVKKLRSRFSKGERIYLMVPGPERP